MNLSALFSSFYPEYSVPQPVVQDNRGPVERVADTIERALAQHEEKAEQYRLVIERNTQLLNETLTVIEALSNARVTLQDSMIDPAFEAAIALEVSDYREAMQ